MKTIAIVGCGSIGGKYARILKSLGVKLVLVDVDYNKAQKIVDEIGSEFSKAVVELKGIQCDGVIVATPPDQHLSAVEEVCQYGIPVLLEKPLAHNIEAATKIKKLVKTKKMNLLCVCNMRFHPAVQSLKNNIDSVGQILTVRSYFGHRLSQMRPVGTNVFASSSSRGGGVVLDCVHDLDVLNWIVGELTLNYSCNAQIGSDKIDANDWSLAHLSSGKIQILTQFDFLMRRKSRGIEIVGTEGNLIWESCGKAPERVKVLFATNEKEEVLFLENNLNQEIEYIEMLKSFMNGGASLQSVDVAHDIFNMAISIESGKLS